MRKIFLLLSFISTVFCGLFCINSAYADSYAVTYSCGDGSGNAPTDSNSYVSGSSVTTASNSCTAPSGKEFTKWFCGSTHVNAGETFTITSDTTCTARYVNVYNVTYSCGDGSGTPPTDSNNYHAVFHFDSSIYSTNDIANATNMTWRTTFSYGVVSGEALCSITTGSWATVGNPDESSSGENCWCRATDPVLSRWVSNTIGSGSDCASGCAYRCARDLGLQPGFRSTMLGSVISTNSNDLLPGDTVTTATNSCTAPSGKVFVGWLCGTTNVDEGSTFTISADTTCTAQYDDDLYNVTYSCGAGSGTAPTDSTDYTINDSVTTLSNTCTAPSGKGFSGWLCGSEDVNAGSTFTISSDTTCTAQYVNVYNVTYSCGDGSGTPPTDSNNPYVGGVLDPTINGTRYRSSEAYNNWTTYFSYGSVSGASMCSSTPGTSYAVAGTLDETKGQYCWCRAKEPISSRWVFLRTLSDCAHGCAADCGYYIRYDTQLRSTMFEPVTYVTTLSNTCTAPSGRVFNGWRCGSKNVNAGETFVIIADTTCTAQYSYNVTYSCGDGSGTPPTDSNNYLTGNSVTTTANSCTAPSGKVFSKWLCGSTNVNAGGTFTISSDTTCTAQYVDVYNVTYSCGDGSGNAPTDSTDYTTGATVATLSNSCSAPSGKKFTGWLCGATNVDAGSAFTISSDTTCTAQYINTCASNGNINSGYTILQYLQGGQNTNSYINLGYAATATMRTLLVASVISDVNQQVIFGASDATAYANGKAYSIDRFPSYILLPNGEFNDTTSKISISTSLNTVYQFKINYPTVGTIGVDNNTKTAFTNLSSVSSKNLYLFGFNSNNTYSTTYSVGAMRVYRLTMWDGNDMIHKYIPAKRDSDDVLGMCDTVTGDFLTNAGSGSFTTGPEIQTDLNVTYSCGDGSGTPPTDSNNYVDQTIDGISSVSNTENMTWMTIFPYGDISGVALCSTTSGNYNNVGTPVESGGEDIVGVGLRIRYRRVGCLTACMWGLTIVHPIARLNVENASVPTPISVQRYSGRLHKSQHYQTHVPHQVVNNFQIGFVDRQT